MPLVADRSPLHPHALNLSDIREGVEYIYFSLTTGEMGRGTFQSGPHMARPVVYHYSDREPVYLNRHMQKSLVVEVLDAYGRRHINPFHYGLAPEEGEWNKDTFTIRTKDAATLPVPRSAAPPPYVAIS